MKISRFNVHKIRALCYLYGIYIWVTPFLLTPEISNTIYSLTISFISTTFFIFIMNLFKESLNNKLHSVRMDATIKYMMYMYIAAYSLNVLALKDPLGIFPFQALLGLGLISLFIVYGILLRNLDAPLEKLKKLKYLNLYSNCILLSMAMVFTIIGVIFFIILLGASYFILGNLFVEIYNIDKEESLNE